MQQALEQRGVPADTAALLVHNGCASWDDLQCVDNDLLDALGISKAFVRKRLLQLKLELVSPSAELDDIALVLSSVNILPEKCQTYARLLARDGFDSTHKLGMVTEEDLIAVGITSLYDSRVILGLAKSLLSNGRIAIPSPTVPFSKLTVAPTPELVPTLTIPPVPSTTDLPIHTAPTYFTLQTPYTEGPDSYDELAIISLNILADCNLQASRANPQDKRYPHLTPDKYDWGYRFRQLRKLLLLHINEGNVDVFCLQEVDFIRFHSDIKPFLDRQGFCAWHQWDGNDDGPRNDFGVAICYRHTKFRETFRESRSRTMIVGLATPTTEWFVVNCHLEADPKKTDKRLAQLSSTLFNLSIHTKLDPKRARMVVVGDFNSSRDDASFQWLVDPQPVDETSKVVAPHAFHLYDAYQNAPSDVYEAMTYADSLVAYRVDHVVFTVDTCAVMETLRIPLLHPNTTGKYGIFYGEHFTDHYPVGCLLQALPLPPPPLPEEPETSELTNGQMRVLEFLQRGAPMHATTVRRGKPTSAEIEAMRAHTQSMNVFLSHLNKSQKSWVAQWRKKHHPSPTVEPTVVRITRTRSFSDEALMDVASLFDEGNERPRLLHSQSARF
ncbi:hypothetical protein BASA81_002075 [Batrachochytrium salamandrivorans]|nr:hypothetical protein BASA81_002075 [Batrachochytrium salamandrivorans]